MHYSSHLLSAKLVDFFRHLRVFCQLVYCFQVIPAENMVAAFQDSNTALYATAKTARDAQVYLEALEKGTDGIVLQTEDPAEVFALKVQIMV